VVLIVHRARCHNLLHEQHLHPENIMPLQWQSDDLEDVSFNAYLCVELAMDDEQVSELIYLCRKSHIGVEQVYPTTDVLMSILWLIIVNKLHKLFVIYVCNLTSLAFPVWHCHPLLWKALRQANHF
jgi:(p)ppGpp synthase/HD superfamily hydrolase